MCIVKWCRWTHWRIVVNKKTQLNHVILVSKYKKKTYVLSISGLCFDTLVSDDTISSHDVVDGFAADYESFYTDFIAYDTIISGNIKYNYNYNDIILKQIMMIIFHIHVKILVINNF